VCSAPPLAKKTFGPARAVTTDASPGMFQMEPSAALDAEGNVVITYVGCDLPDGPNSVVAAKVLPDGRVAGERKIATGVDNHYDPWITALRDGTFAAVWLGFDGNYGPLGAVKPQSPADWIRDQQGRAHVVLPTSRRHRRARLPGRRR
jgi:hypothetical protein